jgi:hypothetical protein
MELACEKVVTPPAGERHMAERRANKNSWINTFWDFIEVNPKLAATIALQLGVVAGRAVSTQGITVKSMTKRVKNMPHQIADVMPQGLSAAALKYLPGPKLQARKRPVGKVRRARIAKAARAAS